MLSFQHIRFIYFLFMWRAFITNKSIASFTEMFATDYCEWLGTCFTVWGFVALRLREWECRDMQLWHFYYFISWCIILTNKQWHQLIASKWIKYLKTGKHSRHKSDLECIWLLLIVSELWALDKVILFLWFCNKWEK